MGADDPQIDNGPPTDDVEEPTSPVIEDTASNEEQEEDMDGQADEDIAPVGKNAAVEEEGGSSDDNSMDEHNGEGVAVGNGAANGDFGSFEDGQDHDSVGSDDQVQSGAESTKEKDDETPAAEGTKENSPPLSPSPSPQQQKRKPSTHWSQRKSEPRMVPLPVFGETFRSIDDKTRKQIHGKLRAYESRRRTAYASKLESSALYWRSFRDLLHSSVYETARAERIVIGTAKANLLYAEAMAASYDDCLLDDRGNMTLSDPKRQQKLLEGRARQQYDMAPVVREDDNLKKRPPPSEQRRNNILHALLESQLDLSEKFEESASKLLEEICQELTALRKNLTLKVLTIRKLGDIIIEELERTDQEVKDAWEAYYAMATKVLGGSNMASSRDMRAGASMNEPNSAGTTDRSQTPNPSDKDKQDLVENCNDVWIVEMHYRVVVTYQATAWERGSAELSKLFSQMKEAECQRRIQLREYLVAFTQRQQRLFAQLPEVHTPALTDLVGRDMDRSKLEKVVQTKIQGRAEQLQREEAKHRRSGAKKGSGLSNADPNLAGDFTLESPLLSDLIAKSKVIERKGVGMMASWKTCLAIVTADSFLHLFELPASSGFTTGSAPEVAFNTLIPTSDPPDAANPDNLPMTYVKGWCDALTPTESMVLANCKISASRNSATFDISETMVTTGANRMFSKTTSRKVTLRTVNQQDTADFIATLKSQK
uniref:Uncharacterized protein n=1 Tax=Grammatophora oceanica TaxID=210454 RepID=A0A7S1Y5K9_9STRA|mmetsp:Transcript_28245/g.41595  ORF Transcript_28245/g.41595 Transcript_28245/m.41595 type:complete len:711 (+) Transcript_28245:134-2266(+)